MNPYNSDGNYIPRTAISQKLADVRANKKFGKFLQEATEDSTAACDKMFDILNNSRNSRNTKLFYQLMSMHLATFLRFIMEESVLDIQRKTEISLEVHQDQQKKKKVE